MSRGIVLGMLRPETRAITVDHATGATNAKRCPAASQEEYGKEAAPSPHEARSSLYVLGRRASGWGSELWSAEPLHSLQARISDSSARFFDNSCERGPTTVWPAALDPLFLSGSYSSLFYNAVHVYIHPYDDGGYAPPLLHRGGHSWLRCPHHVHARARTLSRHSCIDPACSPSTPSLPTPHHHHPPAALPITSQFFTVHNRRQSMSRGGKLAPEVNRYVRPSPHRVRQPRLHQPTHTTFALTCHLYRALFVKNLRLIYPSPACVAVR